MPGGAADEERTLEGCKALGATEKDLEEIREALRQQRSAAVFHVWPENWRAFELFDACAWRKLVLPGFREVRVVYDGLDYSLLADLDQRLLPPSPGIEVPPQRELFRQIRVLESTARMELNAGG